MERFWNPLNNEAEQTLKDILLNALVLKKFYLRDGEIFGYNPQKDLKRYEKNKDKFWKDDNFRKTFLDSLCKTGEKVFNGKNFSGAYFKRDFIFLGALAPENLFYSLFERHRYAGDPLNLAFSLLDYHINKIEKSKNHKVKKVK